MDAGAAAGPAPDAAPGAHAALGIDAAPATDAALGTDAALDADAAFAADICADAAWGGGSEDSGLEPKIAWRSRVGAACAGESDCACRGAMCVLAQTLLNVGSERVVRYAEGYCTAVCKQSAECGSNAKCPFADAFARVDIPVQYGAVIAELLANESLCFETCTTQDECRSGYQCNTVAAVFAGDGAVVGAAAFARSVLQSETSMYCLPLTDILSNP